MAKSPRGPEPRAPRHGSEVASEPRTAEAASGETPLVTEAPYRNALLIANPVAGRGRCAQAAEELAAGLVRLGVDARLVLTRERGHAVRELRSAGPLDLVVAVGGDGTVREVFSGLVDLETPVGILPFGTANVLGTELGLPRDVHRALEIVLAKRTARIDTARVNGHLSLLVTGVGIDGMAVREVEERRDGPITKWSYVGAVVRALRHYQEPKLEVEIDGSRVEGEFGLVVVGNTVSYGGILRMAPDTRMDDGLFEVYLFPGGSRRELLGYALRGFLSRLPSGDAAMRRAKHVRIEAEEPVPYQVDGDYGGTTPVEICVTDIQYRVLVP